MKLFPMLLATLSLAAVSCERHEFEGEHGTKQLHTHGKHGDHHDEDHAAEADDHH